MLNNNLDVLVDSCGTGGLVLDRFSHGKMGLVCKEDVCFDDGGKEAKVMSTISIFVWMYWK